MVNCLGPWPQTFIRPPHTAAGLPSVLTLTAPAGHPLGPLTLHPLSPHHGSSLLMGASVFACTIL